MRTSLTIFMVSIGLFATSCQSDEDLGVTSSSTDNIEEGKTSVKFELDASAIGYDLTTKANQYSPVYDKDGFSIYAFKQGADGINYAYEKTISMTKLSYAPATKKLTGSDLLPIGTYKFLAVYGLDNQRGLNGQPNLLTIPTWSSQVLSNNFTIGYNGGNGLTEIFLPVKTANVETLESYDMGLTNETPNKTVTAKLQRAVSRVDIMFIKAQKGVDGTYTETPYATNKNVFGEKSIKTIELDYKGLNNLMSFFGSNLTTTRFDSKINLDLSKSIILIGDHATETTIGKNGYLSYDNIKSSELIYGAAHVFGNYLLPNNNAEKSTALSLYIESTDGSKRTINLGDANKIPTERNKVTLVKIYVLEDGDEDPENPPHVFNTKVNFEVEIETVWDGSNEVTGEIN